MDTSECAEINKICVESTEQVLIKLEILFYLVEFQNKTRTQTSATYNWRQHYLKKIDIEVDREKKETL